MEALPVRLPDQWPGLLLLLLQLTACGGGSGDSAPQGPAADDPTNASFAGVNLSLDLATNVATVEWADRFANASGYRIEQQSGDGTWLAIDTVWGGQGSEQALDWTGAISTPATFRVEAVLPGSTVPLGTAIGRKSIEVILPAAMPTILFDQAQPLTGSVSVSIGGGGAYASVGYSIDSTAFGFSATAPPYATMLDLSQLTTGRHLITADLQMDAGLTFRVSRTVEVHTAAPAMKINVVTRPDVVAVYVTATSDFGIQSVDTSVDAFALGSLVAPDTCGPTPCASGQSFSTYHFAFNTHTIGTGTHLIAVKVTDAAGNAISTTAHATLPSPNTATLDFPTEGALVYGTLHVSGTYSSGTPGALELMLTLSGNRIYDTSIANPGTTVPYAADINLAGVTPGSHTLGVQVRVGNGFYDSPASEVITVASSPP